jgi:hypothetical protein
MTTSTRTAKQAAREAEDSKPVEGMARFGFAGRGVVYVALGLLALHVALGHGGRADKNGALAAVRDQPLGTPLLVLLAVAFTGYAGWRLLESVAGHRDTESGKKRTVKRLASLGRAGIYGSFAYTTVRFVMTSSAGRDKTRSLTARALDMPGGQVLVGLVGAALVCGGVVMVYRGLRQKLLKKLDLSSAPQLVRRLAGPLGLVGIVSRGVLVGLVGGFLVQAAVTFDPKKAKGLDATLKSLTDKPLGSALMVVLAVGLIAFGASSFVEARYRRV